MTALTKKSTFVVISFLLVYSAIIFLLSVKLRVEYIGSISFEHHQWNMAAPILFTKNWLRENPLTLKFSMISEPASIEFASLNKRAPYLSYPPGAIIPIYLFCLLLKTEPSVVLVNSFGLLNHFLVSTFLGLLVFFLLRLTQHSVLLASISYLISTTLAILLPVPMYWFLGAYLFDQAVLLPVVIFMVLEVLLDLSKDMDVKSRKALRLLQVFSVLYGALTDWFFYVFLSIVFLKRLRYLTGSAFRRTAYTSVVFWLPVAIVLVLYTFQISSFDEPAQIVRVFLIRTGILPNPQEIDAASLWHTLYDHFIQGYGASGAIALATSVFFFIAMPLLHFFRKSKALSPHPVDQLFTYSNLLIVPAVLYLLIFNQHAAVHDFSVLKFMLILSAVSFVLLPIVALHIFACRRPRNNKFIFENEYVPALICIVLSVIYLSSQLPRLDHFFPKDNPDIMRIGTAVDSCTSYTDVVFSPEFEIPTYPPHYLAFSMKRIYKITSWADIGVVTDKITEDHNVVLFFMTNPADRYPQLDLELFQERPCGGFYFYKV